MTVIHFLVRNWAMKGGALLLAIILFVAMVALQSTQSWPGQVSIEPVNQSPTLVLIKPDVTQTVGSIRYIAPPDVRVSATSFRATIDLKDAKASSSDSLVKVQLVADDPRIQIIDYQPQQILVRLDPLETKQVSVTVVPGTIPAGLSMGPQTLSASSVDAVGASSAVARVSRAEGQVRIDASGLDVNDDVTLVPVDASGNVVNGVQLNPATIHVRIQVGSQLRTETVPINVVFTLDKPVAGYYITSIDVSPAVVSVSGQANALALLGGMANTAPVSLAGATGDVTASVALALPPGVEAPDVTTVSVVVHLQSPASTRTLQIGLVPDRARSDRLYTLSVPNVTVTLGGATAALNAFDTSTLVGHVGVGDLSPGTYTIQITITLPSGIKLVAMSPAQITVTVAIPPSPPPSGSPAPTG
jgi:YbbR domain-containing protein